MSRTWKDDIRNRPRAHLDAPFWKYRWWLKHGPNKPKSNAGTRRVHNRIFRAKCKQAMREGRDPPQWRRDLSWVWW
jgi:hypothetical protein